MMMMKPRPLCQLFALLIVAPLLVAGSAATEATAGYHERAVVHHQVDDEDGGVESSSAAAAHCAEHLQGATLDEISFAVHRNGDPETCGVAASSVQSMLTALAAQQQDCSVPLDKYQVEAFLTEFLANGLLGGGCESTNDENAIEGGLLSYCDMGQEKTVIQNDYTKLVRVVSSSSLPCRWFTREGLRISSLQQLRELAEKTSKEQAQDCSAEETCTARNTLSLYAVPAGRVFMFAPSFVGETFTLSHVQDAEGNTVSLEVLSLEPRVFDIFHFFNQQESAALVEKALGETSETHKFHRSTTGTSSSSVITTRTSENAWDTHGSIARDVKRRCFNLLGFDEYDETMADGLQILRYNMTTAYTSHLDYLEDKAGTESYDYDSAGKGGNRFATILLYFTDLGERDGGETVFSRAWPPGVAEEDRVELKDAIAQLRASGDATMLEEGSWEEEMTALCRTRLSVRPRATRAVLFYSQFPNGELDPMSYHGGCPVLRGTKLAANLWTWSGIRPEYEGAPRKFEEKPKAASNQIKAVFRNTGTDARFKNAEVYYDEDGFFGKLGFGDEPVYVNTYVGHRWNIKVDGKTLQTFVIDEQGEQTFEV